MSATVRPSRDLRILQHRSLERVARLRGVVDESLLRVDSSRNRSDTASIDHAIAYTIIELDNLWAGTARSLFLSAAFRARDGSGTRVELSKVPQPSDAAEALKHAGGRADRWWKQRSLLRALENVGASNAPQVQMALNATPNVFEYLHTFRNFYAHRGHGTRQKLEASLRKLQFPRHYSATRALISPRPTRGRPRPQPLVLDWLDEMRTTIELLV